MDFRRGIPMKRLIHATLILFIVFMLVGCGAQSPAAESGSTSDYVSSAPSGKMVSVYYIKDGFLTPVAYNVGVSELEVNAALNLLFSGITPEGFENKLDDVKLNSLVIDGDTVFIDVSGEFLQGKMIDLAKNQIIYTLTDCENIFKVNIAVDGKPYETLLERPPFINLTNPEDYEKDKENPEEMSKYLTIYYTDQDKEYLIPVTIKSDKIEPKTENSDKPSTVKAEDKARAALQHLIEGTEKIKTVAPEIIRIKSLRIEDGIAEVDLYLNMHFKFHNEAQYAEIAVEAVVRTLTSIDEIERVQFLINGKNQVGYVTSNLSIQNPIEPDRWVQHFNGIIIDFSMELLFTPEPSFRNYGLFPNIAFGTTFLIFFELHFNFTIPLHLSFSKGF